MCLPVGMRAPARAATECMALIGCKALACAAVTQRLRAELVQHLKTFGVSYGR